MTKHISYTDSEILEIYLIAINYSTSYRYHNNIKRFGWRVYLLITRCVLNVELIKNRFLSRAFFEMTSVRLLRCARNDNAVALGIAVESLFVL